MGKYLKVAFWNRWNLLALMAGIGVSIVSLRPDVVLPLLAAGELAYLGFLATHPRFRAYVDIAESQQSKLQQTESKQQALERILRALPRQAIDRYEQLKSRCLELRKIAADLQGPPGEAYGGSLDSLQLQGLDRLLWVYLRLLFTYHSLSLFLDKTQVDTIYNDIERLENRLKLLDNDESSEHSRKIRRALDDNLATCRQRLENYEKARANHEFVELEIDRLANKIKSLAELAVNRREPDFISSQVDAVAGSMVETEKTINDLDFATGLGHLEEEVPDLLPKTQVFQ